MPVEAYDGRPRAWTFNFEDLARRELPVIMVEDHGLPGEPGAAVAKRRPMLAAVAPPLGIPDQWIPCGSQSDQKKMAGIDAEAIVNLVMQDILSP